VPAAGVAGVGVFWGCRCCFDVQVAGLVSVVRLVVLLVLVSGAGNARNFFLVLVRLRCMWLSIIRGVFVCVGCINEQNPTKILNVPIKQQF
jgi:hypothetical protein